MLHKLLKRKPRLDAPEAAARIAALAALADDAQDEFERLARNDADAAVRVAALARLTRLPPLVAMLEDAALAAEAAQRLLALADEDTPASVRRHPAVLRAAVAAAETADAATQAAAEIADASERASAILAHPHAGVRLAVVETIWHPPLLAAVEKAARGTDSATHRLARERGSAHRSALAERERQDAQATELLAAAGALDAADPHYPARHSAVERKWRDTLTAIETTDHELARYGVVARDVEALRLRFPTRRRTAPAARPAERAAKAEAFAELLGEVEALPAAAHDVAASEPAVETLSERLREFARQANAIGERWNALAEVEQPTPTLRERFQAALAEVFEQTRPLERAEALAEQAAKMLHAGAEDPNVESIDERKRELTRRRTAVERLIERYDWPDSLAEPAPLQALRQGRDALTDALSRCDAETEELAQKAADELAQLRHCVETGAAQQAMALDQRVRNLVRRLPPNAARELSAEMAEVGAALRELRDWRLYAETPKREELCREMEALAEHPLPVPAQTEAVRALRQRWNALGRADMGRARAFTKRFEAAAEQAFAPCRSHFKEQAERRAFNLGQRRAIVTALEEFLEKNDWEHADWRGVERVLRQARNEWRSYHPVDRKAEKDLKPRFEKLAGDIHGKLKDAWSQHLQAKEEIVAEAAQVRESGQQASAKADAMKALQRRWKNAGPAPRSADQRLWKRFRAECDAVFEDRTAAMGRHHERRNAIAEAEALVSELERRVDLDAALDRNAVADYQHRLDALGSLPKELRRRAETTIADADRTVVENQRGG